MDGLARISVFRRLCAWRRDLHFGLSEAWLRRAPEPSCLHPEVSTSLVAYLVLTGYFADCSICSDSD
jgi:hypothetical protein